MAFLAAVLGATSRSFLISPLPCGKIHGEYPNFPDASVGQRNGYQISLYNLADIRCNRA